MTRTNLLLTYPLSTFFSKGNRDFHMTPISGHCIYSDYRLNSRAWTHINTKPLTNRCNYSFNPHYACFSLLGGTVQSLYFIHVFCGGKCLKEKHTVSHTKDHSADRLLRLFADSGFKGNCLNLFSNFFVMVRRHLLFLLQPTCQTGSTLPV